MISLYKDVLKEVDGYFSATGAINWERMSVYLEKLREMEVHRLSDLAEHAKLLAEKKSSGRYSRDRNENGAFAFFLRRSKIEFFFLF